MSPDPSNTHEDMGAVKDMITAIWYRVRRTVDDETYCAEFDYEYRQQLRSSQSTPSRTPFPANGWPAATICISGGDGIFVSEVSAIMIGE